MAGGGQLLRQHRAQKVPQGGGQRFLAVALAEIGGGVLRVLGKVQSLYYQIFVGGFQTAFFDQAFGKVGVFTVRRFALGLCLRVFQFLQFGLCR